MSEKQKYDFEKIMSAIDNKAEELFIEESKKEITGYDDAAAYFLKNAKPNTEKKHPIFSEKVSFLEHRLSYFDYSDDVDKQKRANAVKSTLASHRLSNLYPTELMIKMFFGYVEGFITIEDCIITIWDERGNYN